MLESCKDSKNNIHGLLLSFWKIKKRKDWGRLNGLELGIKERFERKKQQRPEVEIWISKDIRYGTRASGGGKMVL